MRTIPASALVAQGKLTVNAHFGIGGIRFVHKDGHNHSSVTATPGLFESNGSYLKASRMPSTWTIRMRNWPQRLQPATR